MENLIDILPANLRQEITLPQGNAAFHQGDTATGIYAVRHGKIQLQRHSEAGTKTILYTASAGDTFAEASLYSNSYHCDAIALEPSRIIKFSKADIVAKIASQPEFAAAIIKQFSLQVQSCRRMLELRAIRSAKDRVYAAMAAGMMGPDIKSFATDIGLTHEATYRALSKLTDQGLIKKHTRGKYQICTLGTNSAKT